MEENFSTALPKEDNNQNRLAANETEINITPMRKRSRLARKFEKKIIRNTLLMALGTILIVFMLLKFGALFLIGLSSFLSSGNQTTQSQGSNNQIGYIAPPILNPAPSATNSAHVIVSGKAAANETVNIYINNNLEDKILTDNNGDFSITEDLSLGSNSISVKAEKNSKQSDYSNSLSVFYQNSQPKLDINSPTDGQKFDKNTIGTGNAINVTGTTDPGVSVTVNGFWAIVDDSNNFSYSLSVQSGDNQIKVIAIDQAGNKAEKDLKVNYSQ